jgi:ribosomal protein S12 methylthiotransferase
MLRAMRRGITGPRQRALLERVREKIPGVAIRTTLIAGFPGETEADHRESLDAVLGGAFDRLGVFLYVREEGTPSHDLPDQVPAEVAARRRDELMAAQQQVHFARNRARVGAVVEVLVEEGGGNARETIGRTERDAPEVDGRVRIRPALAERPGSFARVEVVGVDGYDLVARPLPVSAPVGAG